MASQIPEPVTTRAVTVVIPTWNGWHLLSPCLQAIRGQSHRAARVIVVDNGSSDDTVRHLAREFPEVEVVALAANAGFAGGCNAGMRTCPDDDVVLLNNDAIPRPEWLRELVAAAHIDHRVGIITSKLLDGDLRIESTGDYLDAFSVPSHRGKGHVDDGEYDAERNILSACAGAVLLRRDLLDDIGDLDEAFFAYYEDVDLSLRARLAGWEVAYAPLAVVEHSGSATSNAMPGFRRYHTARNIWWLHVKNQAGWALATSLLRTIVVQPKWIAGAIRHRQLPVLTRAYVHAAKGLPRVWAQRRAVQSARRVEATTFRRHVLEARRTATRS